MSRWALALAALLLLASPASAQSPPVGYSKADPPSKRGEDGLRGSGGASPAPVAPATPSRQRDPVLMSPTLLYPTAPRLTGWSGPEAGGGGAQCRTACASDQYRCSALDSGDCASIWIKCVAACPEGSSGPL